VFGNARDVGRLSGRFINVHAIAKMATRTYPSRLYPDFPHHTHQHGVTGVLPTTRRPLGCARHTLRRDGVEPRASERMGRGRSGWTRGDAPPPMPEGAQRPHTGTAAGPEPAFPGDDTSQARSKCLPRLRDNSIFVGRTWVVMGMGNSAMESPWRPPTWAHPTKYLAARKGEGSCPSKCRASRSTQIPKQPAVPFCRSARSHDPPHDQRRTGRPERYGLPARITSSASRPKRVRRSSTDPRTATIAPEAEHRLA